MHKRRADFDPLKFTPAVIHNLRNLPRDELITFFQEDHSLGDCARHFNCSKATIKRYLRRWGVDTARYNHSELARRRRAAGQRSLPSDTELVDLFIVQNLDAKTIAENAGVHTNTVRHRLRTLGLRKTPQQIAVSQAKRHQAKHGCPYPAQRSDVLEKTRRSAIKATYMDVRDRQWSFRSLHELCYAMMLDHAGREWYYEEMRVPYTDMLNGKRRVYIIDFTVVGTPVEWVEVKPADDMIPDDKRIYAQRLAAEGGVIYRGLTTEEIASGWNLFTGGYRRQCVRFLRTRPRCGQTKITYWFEDEDTATKFTMEGWVGAIPIAVGPYWKRTLRVL